MKVIDIILIVLGASAVIIYLTAKVVEFRKAKKQRKLDETRESETQPQSDKDNQN